MRLKRKYIGSICYIYIYVTLAFGELNRISISLEKCLLRPCDAPIDTRLLKNVLILQRLSRIFYSAKNISSFQIECNRQLYIDMDGDRSIIMKMTDVVDGILLSSANRCR